jgi:prepilin-type processing-associated H-X9-DG protein
MWYARNDRIGELGALFTPVAGGGAPHEWAFRLGKIHHPAEVYFAGDRAPSGNYLDCDVDWSQGPAGVRPGFRHNKKNSMLYVDGHAELLGMDEVPYTPWDWDSLPWYNSEHYPSWGITYLKAVLPSSYW